MKQDHESQFTEQGKQLTQKMLQQIENEAEFFGIPNRIGVLNLKI